MLVYTTVLTTAAVWLPITALFVRHGPLVGAAGIAAFYACSTSTALAVLMGLCVDASQSPVRTPSSAR